MQVTPQLAPTTKFNTPIIKDKSIEKLFYTSNWNQDYIIQHKPEHTEIPQHLYLTSNEKIMEGDNAIGRDNMPYVLGVDQFPMKADRKIVATTNNELWWNEVPEMHGIPAGKIRNVPSIPKDLIELYIKEYNDGKKIENLWLECKDWWNEDPTHTGSPDKPNLNPQLKLNPDGFIIWTLNERFEDDEDYPSYDASGGNKNWDDMTDLEKANYKIRKLYNAIAAYKNKIKSLREKSQHNGKDVY